MLPYLPSMNGKIDDLEQLTCRECGATYDFSVKRDISTFPGVCKALRFCTPACRRAYYARQGYSVAEVFRIIQASLVCWFTKLVFAAMVIGLILWLAQSHLSF